MHLRVKPPNVEKDCSSFKGHSLLGARHSREGVIPVSGRVIFIAEIWSTFDSPLKVQTTAPVGREEPSLDKVKLVVILEE